ncbi:tetratricopeptide repeat protein 31 isoform X2 [Bombina bombina]|uniref:tetratricopeptide repeat protein 31 isoform X2 n=1 Tax=Bombina bombina TaxID=8345 RepID=UPI00235ADA2F|nr:tetratricopeptide repeat protein 31 isoform X2 [Bombina bombina]XP_053560386.1 tetratricopeptide repeat protein 31 isoform X2 [Bombina bombina]
MWSCESDEERYLDDYFYYNGDDDDDDDEDDNSWGGAESGTYCGLRPSFLFPPLREFNLPAPTVRTKEEADRNAEELLEEERRKREKGDRKKLKKKRQKERKRQQKLEESKNDVNKSEVNQVLISPAIDCSKMSQTTTFLPEDLGAGNGDPTESVSEDDLDLESTFVQQAQKKMENKPKPERKERSCERSAGGSLDRVSERSVERTPEKCPEPAPAKLHGKPQESTKDKVMAADRYQIQQSLDLATIGNHMAASERFEESINFYTEAIKLNPSEHRFLGNRSYCYERIRRYTEALQDAELALQLEPHFIKGLFRKGKALKGLKKYSEAINTFQLLLSIDVTHTEAAIEITRCKQMVQVPNGSVRMKVVTNSAFYSGVPSRRPLLPHPVPLTRASNGIVQRYVGYTRAEDTKKGNPTNTPGQLLTKQPSTTTNSKLFPVWVGNVTYSVTEKILRSLFEPFGMIHSLRILYSRTCAFINYTSKQSAEQAFYSLQGKDIEGTTFVLQLRNPEHSNLNPGTASSQKPLN